MCFKKQLIEILLFSVILLFTLNLILTGPILEPVKKKHEV
jgi:hypothetical protein